MRKRVCVLNFSRLRPPAVHNFAQTLLKHHRLPWARPKAPVTCAHHTHQSALSIPAPPAALCSTPSQNSSTVPSANRTRKLQRNPHNLPKLDSKNDPAYKVIYVRSVDAVDGALELCRGPVMGFDIEWKVVYVRGARQRRTALVQLCNETHIGLFHVHHMRELPESLRRVLEDSSIVKLGVNIRGDARKLHRDFGLCMSGWLEINDLAKRVMGNKLDSSLSGLDVLVEKLLGAHLDKNDIVRKGNWEVKFLSPIQEAYAATDVYATYKVWAELVRLGKSFEMDLALPLGDLQEYLRDRERRKQEEGDRAQKAVTVNRNPDADYFEDADVSIQAKRDEKAADDCNNCAQQNRCEEISVIQTSREIVTVTRVTTPVPTEATNKASLPTPGSIDDTSYPSDEDTDWSGVMDSIEEYIGDSKR